MARHRASVGLALTVAIVVLLLLLPASSRRGIAISLTSHWALVLPLLLFGGIAVSLLWSIGQRLDVWLFRVLNFRGFKAPWLDRAMIIATLLGNQWFVAVLVAVSYLVGDRGFAVSLALGSLTLWLVVTIVKAVTDRTRPFLSLTDARVIGYRERGRSFPSGHTAQTFYWVTLACGHLPVPLAAAAGLYCLAILVALTRVYLGMHYPRDVFAGAILAIIWGSIGGIVTPYL